jgi:hypothetical protein
MGRLCQRPRLTKIPYHYLGGIVVRNRPVPSIALRIQHSLKNHEGKGAQIVGESASGAVPTERGRQLRYSKLVRNDQPSCGNLAGRWPLVSALLAAGIGGPSRPPAPAAGAASVSWYWPK